MIIEDGTGKGNQAKVNDQNMLGVNSISTSLNQYANTHGHFYSMTNIVTPDSTSSCFFYLKNKDDTALNIKRLTVHVASNEIIKCYVNDVGTPVGGNEYIPINRNIGSNQLCNVETRFGASITGLTGGALFERLYIPADNNSHIHRWESSIIIPKNRIFTLYAQNGGIEINLTLTAFY